MLRNFSRTLCVVFDIDGVIIDSKEMVREAYRRVGVTMPESAWGKPWMDWLPKSVSVPRHAYRVHSAKNAEYFDLIKNDGLITLPGNDFAHMVRSEGIGDVMFLTGASQRSAELILETLGHGYKSILGHSKSREGKIAALLRHKNRTGGRIVYIDDDEIAAYDIQKRTGIETIYYHGQSVEELEDAIWMP